MARIFLAFCLFYFATNTFGQKNDTTLYHSYKSASISGLQVFFENWASETAPITKETLEKLNDTTKNIYQIFQAFYNPIDIRRTGGSEWGNDIYKNVKYFIIQNKINFSVVESLSIDTNHLRDIELPKNENYILLQNFRPQLSFPNIKCVTLTDHYDSVLNRFLGNSHYKLGAGNLMSPAKSKGESEKRMQFLSSCIKIWYGHWGGYWQLHSYPYAIRIILDKGFQNAIVDYRMVYEGGYAYLKKVNNDWKLIKGERTWIE
ncbi:MAG: hypothetical protein C5B52_03200 [Bacteroidetes bacterium]|nr:MAG: hypothetical protein C5B52_03200 [Bacteroidota bacterium]